MTTSDKKEDRIYPLPRREDQRDVGPEQVDPITTGVVDEGNFGLGVGVPDMDERDRFTDPVDDYQKEGHHNLEQRETNRPHDADTRITEASMAEVNERATKDLDLEFFRRARNNFEELPLQKADLQTFNGTVKDFAEEEEELK
ncbi:hypothetical protein [Heliorestis convoluta]|uniref:Uncharacterized protein n=1 Tax=Heliorestis convoluta TaxID=356322 RepID=A0A5Q2N535_9FIRM|nr:hypothetical protein [Heliorestis convoluta]QGG49009.1 hypothetical protein FTV88_2920 [Heliorestis convoluta]